MPGIFNARVQRDFDAANAAAYLDEYKSRRAYPRTTRSRAASIKRGLESFSRKRNRVHSTSRLEPRQKRLRAPSRKRTFRKIRINADLPANNRKKRKVVDVGHGVSLDVLPSNEVGHYKGVTVQRPPGQEPQAEGWDFSGYDEQSGNINWHRPGHASILAPDKRDIKIRKGQHFIFG